MIIFDQVSKQFFNDTFGLKNVSFKIDPQEMVLITGPTGSGKTTLMRLITKEYLPTQGDIVVNEQLLSEIKNKKLPFYRREIGVVFQDYRLLPEANVWENIALPLFIAGQKENKIAERITDLLKLVKLEEKADLFPKELSGGEAQRVSIARALATAPPILIADEPTGNLDRDTSLEIIKLLQKINELGTTVLLSTHDVVVLDKLSEIRRLELKDGELLKDTDQKEIREEEVGGREKKDEEKESVKEDEKNKEEKEKKEEKKTDKKKSKKEKKK